jgi:glycine cleavage system aminomethyltransferase T
MAIVQRQVSQPGTKLFVDVRGRRLAAEAVTLPFYHK